MDFTTDQDVTKIWNSVGTYHIYIPKESKAIVETYWQALFEGGNAMYYNMSQYMLMSQLSLAPSVIRFSDQQLNVNLTDTTTVSSTYLPTPTGLTLTTTYRSTPTTVYSYKVTAKNAMGETIPSSPIILYEGNPSLSNNSNNLNWTAVTGATSYNIYGRLPGQEKFITNVINNSFIDNGTITTTVGYPTVNTAITSYVIQTPYKGIVVMGDINCINAGVTLVPNVNFTILDGQYISITNPELLTSSKEILSIQDFSILNPFLSRFFLSIFDPDNSVMPNAVTYYPPFINNFTIFQKADHLLFLMQGIFNALISGPTMGNLRKALNFFYNVPFAYEAGTAAITSDSNFNYITIGDYTYTIPITLTLSITNGQAVNKFQFLTNGVVIDDYISNSGLLLGLIPSGNDYELYFTLAIHVPTEIANLGGNPNFID